MRANETRSPWADAAKAIGIILVVLAHALPKDTYPWTWINLFHMPLFFCVSGYFYTCKGSFIHYALKKIKGLWVPYVVSSIITYAAFMLLGKETFSIKYIGKMLLMVSPGPLLGALWFLPVLLIASLICDLMNRILRCVKFNTQTTTDAILSVICIGMLFLGYRFTLPYKISVALRAVFFMHLGHLLKGVQVNKTSRLVTGLLSMIVVTISAFYTKTSFLNNTYTRPLLSLLAAICGSIGICMLCQSLFQKDKPGWLMCIGRNSLGILIWQFVAFKIVTLIQIAIYQLPMNRIWDFPVLIDKASVPWVLLDLAIGIIGSLCLYKIINKPVQRLLSERR